MKVDISHSPQFAHRRSERGQTIVLIAISIVSLLAMAALAIDVVTLYVARSEIQRAADAAALAGAKAVVDSGITSLSSADLTANSPAIQTLAVNMATAAINAVLLTNTVAANQPTWTNQPLVISYQPTGTTIDNNPHITVSLQQGNLPTFFARIFGRTGATVTASATAEAYNPANLASYTPIAPKCVKPWLVANSDPRQSGRPFVDKTTGAVEAGALSDLPFDLTPDCFTASGTCPSVNPPVAIYPPPPPNNPPRVQYLVAQVTPNGANACPSCAGATNYEQSVECCDANAYQYLNCGAGALNAQWDTSTDPSGASGLSATGAECLIHASAAGSGQGQDTLDPTPWPSTGPMKITAESGPQSGNNVSTSSSIVTVPIIDNSVAIGANVTIVGFLQAFINCVGDGSTCGTPLTRPGDINIQILNVIGCSATPNAATPIVGGNGASPIPVRLITPP